MSFPSWVYSRLNSLQPPPPPPPYISSTLLTCVCFNIMCIHFFSFWTVFPDRQRKKAQHWALATMATSWVFGEVLPCLPADMCPTPILMSCSYQSQSEMRRCQYCHHITPCWANVWSADIAAAMNTGPVEVLSSDKSVSIRASLEIGSLLSP